MNAKEFAHELEKAASFIRQQQAEIEALHRFIDERGETGQLIIWKAQNERK